MPSKSPAQARLFAAVAHSPSFAKKVGIPQSVGIDFNQADKGTGIIRPKPKALPKKIKTPVRVAPVGVKKVHVKTPHVKTPTYKSVNSPSGQMLGLHESSTNPLLRGR